MFIETPRHCASRLLASAQAPVETTAGALLLPGSSFSEEAEHLQDHDDDHDRADDVQNAAAAASHGGALLATGSPAVQDEHALSMTARERPERSTASTVTKS